MVHMYRFLIVTSHKKVRESYRSLRQTTHGVIYRRQVNVNVADSSESE